MPELPDVTLYVERLRAFVEGEVLEGIELVRPFLLRSVEPPLEAAIGKKVVGIERIGKRVVFEMEGDLFLVLHLMISGRLRWKKRGARPPGKNGLAIFTFAEGCLLLTEASSKKRASLHVVAGREGLAEFDRGGLEVMSSSLEEFRAAITRENHTLKRTLTDPRILSGIGNAYSDEILFHARLSPMRQIRHLKEDEIERLHAAVQSTLRDWTDRLRMDLGESFPDKVTAFREGMAVHGRYREPCPVCTKPIQRIRYADNECNYCAQCQNAGRLLADRALSRLLKSDWPKTLDELEDRRK